MTWDLVGESEYSQYLYLLYVAVYPYQSFLLFMHYNDLGFSNCHCHWRTRPLF